MPAPTLGQALSVQVREASWKRAEAENVIRAPNVRRISCSEAPSACGQSGAPLAADCRLTRLQAA